MDNITCCGCHYHLLACLARCSFTTGEVREPVLGSSNIPQLNISANNHQHLRPILPQGTVAQYWALSQVGHYGPVLGFGRMMGLLPSIGLCPKLGTMAQ
jgi:hypothetical protein